MKYLNEIITLLEKYDIEMGGYIDEKDNIILCPNESELPTHNFKYSAKDCLNIYQNNAKLLFHSHVTKDHKPSILDKEAVERIGLPVFIYSKLSKKYSIIEPTGWKNPYVNRTYGYGNNDCFGLVVDYLRNEFNIIIEEDLERGNLRDFVRQQRAVASKIYIDIAKKYNFIILEVKKIDNLCHEDIILYKPNNVRGFYHFAICLDGIKKLHQPNDFPSEITNISADEIDNILCVFRHESKS